MHFILRAPAAPAVAPPIAFFVFFRVRFLPR